MAKRCTWKVKWKTNRWGAKDAVLYDSRGHSRNVINYPKGFVLTAAEKKRAEHVLLAPHCAKR